MPLIRCTCNDEWMDKQYGKGVRVANKTSKTTPQEYRCTKCGRETSQGVVRG